ncbi:MAG: fibronectin type III domain-containing protein, partial [Bacteroidetes bacterium]|nr:fibronectin type III domain-containing protein [Bacteroidota bacterium]
MAVVSHGSFDEGPVVLGLPPYFTFDIPEDDPVFTAWDRSSGISILASQVSDFDTEVANNSAVAGNTAKVGYPPADAAKLAAIEVGATNVDDSLLVPYTGASGDVNLGTYDISVGKVTIADVPANPTDAVTKSYVDGIVASGFTWTTAVKDIVDTLPGAPADADRYILIDGVEPGNNHINQWDSGGSVWVSTHPATGISLFVEGDDTAPVNNIGLYSFNGTSWIYVGSSISTIAHNDTTNKQGGTAPNQYYHLSSAANTTLPNIITTTADIVPTGLAMSNSGITTGSDGSQSAYVTLTWNAITSGTFDHYHVQYKKASLTYYMPIEARTNTITIEGLTPNTSYDFRIASVNKYGTSSAFSTKLTETTAADTVAPTTVTIGSATAGIQYIIIEWTHNADLDLASYNVYRNTSNNSGTASLIGNCRTNYFIDGGRTGDQIYYYWLKAVDASGNVSANFSSVVSATPRNVTTTDVTAISASKILIDGAVYLSNWRHTSDITKIDGGDIYTSSITTSALNFTPLVSIDGTGDIVATINATEEAIQITGEHIEINGSTTFTPLGSVGRVFIFEDANTGIRITDDNAEDVFKVEIGGTNVGDVIIGDWANSQGIKYDKSLGTTTFKGALYASSGTI